MAKREGYWFAVRWIADNDDTETEDVDTIASYISVALVADMFHKEQRDVAIDVYDLRIGRTTSGGR